MHTIISNNKNKSRRAKMENKINNFDVETNVSFVTGVLTQDSTRGGNAQSNFDADDSKCICGKELDNAGADCYSHMTQGY
tara:strand:+ start:72 stop:311 length:240 start_codon:yes stop_codon:yes gene_type:complete